MLFWEKHEHVTVHVRHDSHVRLAQGLSHSYKTKDQVEMIMLDFSKAFDKVPTTVFFLGTMPSKIKIQAG